MGQRSGFFNALKTETGYDIKYNAKDYSQNLAAIISNGVRRSGDNELRVIAAGGMALTINVGRAWIEGCWYINDAIFTDFSVPTAPTGDRARIDRVILRLNENIEARKIELVYLTGDPSTAPVAPTLTREGGVYDIALADIKVNAGVDSILQTDITDQRPNKEVCGWITTPIGYDEYFTNLDSEFNEWFTGVKNNLASVTLLQPYFWSTVLESTTLSVTFNIPQYDPSGVDILEVYSNGLYLTKNKDYTIEGSNIVFTTEKIAGTEILVKVTKSIDGAGLGSVADAVAELQEQMGTIKNIGDYIYICNGFDDNVKLSDIAQQFLSNDTAYDQMIIRVYGTFGANAPYAGSGSSVSRYRWFSLGSAGSTKKKITFDFAGCSQITLNCKKGFHYIGFYGLGINLISASVVANCEFQSSSFQMFSATNGYVYAESCQFYINAYENSLIASQGTFVNCKGTVINRGSSSRCFSIGENCIVSVTGGEYKAYKGSSSSTYTAIVFDSSADNPTGIFLINGVSCPTVAQSGLYQTHAFGNNADFTVKGCIVGLITTLAVNNTGNIAPCNIINSNIAGKL